MGDFYFSSRHNQVLLLLGFTSKQMIFFSCLIVWRLFSIWSSRKYLSYYLLHRKLRRKEWVNIEFSYFFAFSRPHERLRLINSMKCLFLYFFIHCIFSMFRFSVFCLNRVTNVVIKIHRMKVVWIRMDGIISVEIPNEVVEYIYDLILL